MCGRFVATSPVSQLLTTFDVERLDQRLPGEVPIAHERFNVAPRASLAIVRNDGPSRVLSWFRWGLVPSWAKQASVGDKLTNARAETIAEKPSFRAALAKRRCIVPADGYYEWQRDPSDAKRKLPHFFAPISGAPLAFAGLWEMWRDPSQPDQILRTVALVTVEARGVAAEVHHRMPAILGDHAVSDWLDVNTTASEAQGLLVPNPEMLQCWQVSTLVNRATVDIPELMHPIVPDTLF